MSRLLLLVLLPGCDILFQLRPVEDTDAADTPVGSWSKPQPLTSLNIAGSIPTETDASLTGDGLEIFFSSNRAGGEGSYDIYHATRGSLGEPFGAPEQVPALSSGAEDYGAITSDGLAFYTRHSDNTTIELATRRSPDAPFDMFNLVPAFSVVNMPANVELSADGLHAVVDGNVIGSGSELYLFSRTSTIAPWEPPELQSGLSTPGIDGGGTLDREALTMIFHSDRDQAQRKLFMASRPNTSVPFSFDTIEPISELDETIASDPSATPDLRIIVFTRDGDLYMSTR